MNRAVTYRGKTPDRIFSPAVWHNCPIGAIKDGNVEGHFFEDDFRNVEDVAAGASALTYGSYFIDADTGVDLAARANTDHGVIEASANDAANDAFVLVHGNAAGWARFGPNDRVWFEGRYDGADFATGGNEPVAGVFLGFIEVSSAPSASGTIVDTTTLLDVSEDFVGWRALTGDPDAAQPIFQEGGNTLVHVGSGTSNAAGSGNETTMVAGTFNNFGLTWDGKTLSYYVDGARNSYYRVLPTDDFPDTNHLAMCWAAKTVGSDTLAAGLDWWAGAAITV